MRRRGFIKRLLAIGSAVVATPVIGKEVDKHVIGQVYVSGRAVAEITSLSFSDKFIDDDSVAESFIGALRAKPAYSQIEQHEIDERSPITETLIDRIKWFGGE